jgi:hypothetical protein
LISQYKHLEDGIEMPTLALGMLLCDEANLQSKLSNKLFIVCVKEDIEKILDDGTCSQGQR